MVVYARKRSPLQPVQLDFGGSRGSIVT
jgi:hypothetical protein